MASSLFVRAAPLPFLLPPPEPLATSLLHVGRSDRLNHSIFCSGRTWQWGQHRITSTTASVRRTRRALAERDREEGEPTTHRDLLASPRLKVRPLVDARDEVEADLLLAYDELDIVRDALLAFGLDVRGMQLGGREEGREVEACLLEDLWERSGVSCRLCRIARLGAVHRWLCGRRQRRLAAHLADGTHCLWLLLVDLAARERPRRAFGPALDEEDLRDTGRCQAPNSSRQRRACAPCPTTG